MCVCVHRGLSLEYTDPCERGFLRVIRIHRLNPVCVSTWNTLIPAYVYLLDICSLCVRTWLLLDFTDSLCMHTCFCFEYTDPCVCILACY